MAENHLYVNKPQDISLSACRFLVDFTGDGQVHLPDLTYLRIGTAPVKKKRQDSSNEGYYHDGLRDFGIEG
jgi:hypothetical protein